MATESPPYAPEPEPALADAVADGPIASVESEPSRGSIGPVRGEPYGRRPRPPWSEAILPSPSRAHRERLHRRARLRAYCRGALAVTLVGFAVALPKESRGLHLLIDRARSADSGHERPVGVTGREQRKANSSSRRLRFQHRISGDIAPKSVVSSGTGLVFAQNMMYRHSVTVYGRDRRLIGTIPDSVELGKLGFEGYRGTTRGAPVEAGLLTRWQVRLRV